MSRQFSTPDEIDAEREKINGPDADRELATIKKKLLEQGTSNVAVTLSNHCNDAVEAIIRETLHNAGYVVEFGSAHNDGNWARVSKRAK